MIRPRPLAVPGTGCSSGGGLASDIAGGFSHGDPDHRRRVFGAGYPVANTRGSEFQAVTENSP